MSVIPRNPNPNLGFRGNPDGQQGTALVDYGVYAGPIQRALQHYGYHSEILLPGNDAAIKAYINRGWPVITWISYQLQAARPRLSMANGVQFVLVPHEHAILAIGYDDRTIVGNDPWTKSQVRYYWSDFNHSWGYFGNMALAVEPCPVPASLDPDQIHLQKVSTDSMTWNWKPAARAVSYSVVVHLLAGKRQIVYKAVQTVRHVTIDSPVAGAQYQIAVKPISACGGSPGTTRLAAQLPDILPTPTPTEGTVSPTPSPAASTTPTPSATPKP